MGLIVKHYKYLNYIVRHKWFVFRAGRRTGAPLWALIVHDASKLRPDEWRPYAEWFYGEKAGTHKSQRLPEFDAFMDSIKLHYSRNPHHWQYWSEGKAATFRDLEGNAHLIGPVVMPEKYVREMVADWMGAGRAITGKWDIQEWYANNKDKQQLHPATRERVETLLRELGYNV